MYDGFEVFFENLDIIYGNYRVASPFPLKYFCFL